MFSEDDQYGVFRHKKNGFPSSLYTTITSPIGMHDGLPRRPLGGYPPTATNPQLNQPLVSLNGLDPFLLSASHTPVSLSVNASKIVVSLMYEVFPPTFHSEMASVAVSTPQSTAMTHGWQANLITVRGCSGGRVHASEPGFTCCFPFPFSSSFCLFIHSSCEWCFWAEISSVRGHGCCAGVSPPHSPRPDKRG